MCGFEIDCGLHICYVIFTIGQEIVVEGKWGEAKTMNRMLLWMPLTRGALDDSCFFGETPYYPRFSSFPMYVVYYVFFFSLTILNTVTYFIPCSAIHSVPREIPRITDDTYFQYPHK